MVVAEFKNRFYFCARRAGKTAAVFRNGSYKTGGYQSGQMGQTVNLLSFDFGGSNPSPPTRNPVYTGMILRK
jgi:hypothetical protein